MNDNPYQSPHPGRANLGRGAAGGWIKSMFFIGPITSLVGLSISVAGMASALDGAAAASTKQAAGDIQHSLSIGTPITLAGLMISLVAFGRWLQRRREAQRVPRPEMFPDSQT